MGASLAIATSRLIALFLGCIFYGIFTISFSLCIWVLVFRNGRDRPVNLVMLIVAILLFVFASSDIAFALVQAIDGFVLYTGAGGPNQYFSTAGANWVNLARLACTGFQTGVADGLLLYRLYLVYQRAWKVMVLPVLLYIGGTVCGCAVIWIEAHTGNIFQNVNIAQRLSSFGLACFILTLVLNLFVSSLLAYRIWATNRELRKAMNLQNPNGGSPKGFTPVMKIVVESCAIYSVSLLVQIIVYWADGYAFYIVSDIIIHIVGIVFTMLIVRVALGLTYSAATSLRTISLPQFVIGSDSVGQASSKDG